MPVSALRSQLALCLGLMLLCGCEGLWSRQTKGDPGNCVAIPDLCPARQHCNLTTEVCEWNPGEDPEAGPVLPAAPLSYIFPGGAGGVAMQGSWPRDIKYSIATQDPLGTVHYTTDGTVPEPGAAGTSSQPVPALAAIVPGGTVIRWFGDYGPAFAPEPVHVFAANTNPTFPETFGYIPDPVKFSVMDKPVIVVSPGAQVNGTIQVQLWSSTAAGYCPSCIVQWVISGQGIGPILCVDGVHAIGPYPGISVGGPIVFTAPMQPGRYPLYSGLTLQFSCDGTVAGGPDIGLVIVK